MTEKNGGTLAKIDSAVVKVIKCISYISGICLIGIMLVAFFNVLGEKILHHGIPASTEIIQYLHIPVVFLAAAYVTLDIGHTKIDLLSSHFPKAVQAFFTTLGNLLGAFICGFIGYRGLVQMNKFISTHAKSSTTGVGFAKWPFALIFAIGFFLLALSFLWSIVRQYTYIGKKEGKN
jgi:TRAP-type C4-dicarboxylate transport system permease small subunit